MNSLFLKIIATLAYGIMIYVNFLANSLPINGRATGVISDSYPNLFAPAGLTFAIWGVIYLLLLGYVVYQFAPFKNGKNSKKDAWVKKVSGWFIATSVVNSVWIFAWHYDFIGLSVLIMLVFLVLLIRITDILREVKLSTRERLFISLPFSVYFGWITIATIANITVFLVSVGWDGWGISDSIWTSIILVIGAVIGFLRMRKDKSVAYGLVFIWAYLGILLKHVSSTGFNGEHPGVIATVIGCLVFLGICVAWVGYKNRQ